MGGLDTYFLEVSAHTESRHQKFFYRLKPLRISLNIFKLFFKRELLFFHIFGTFILFRS